MKKKSNLYFKKYCTQVAGYILRLLVCIRALFVLLYYTLKNINKSLPIKTDWNFVGFANLYSLIWPK